MATQKNKIALLFCGGSSMVVGDRVISVKNQADIPAWLEAVPEINLIADIDPYFIFGGDASEIQPALWSRIARQIFNNINKYDGFVITHGVDTMIYTAAMMHFMLQPLGVPIIFTGSPLSSEITDSDKQDLSGLISNYRSLGVKANLINAIQVATLDLAEVGIMFGNRLVRGIEAIKSDAPTFNFFDSQTDKGMIGKVDFGIKLFSSTQKRAKVKTILSEKLEPKVNILQLYPGASPELLEQMLGQGSKGILIRSFNTNLFPDSFKPILEKAYRQKIPVVAYNPYALDIKKKKREYIVVNDLTFETTFVKFMWALGQTQDLGELRILMWDGIS